MLNDVFTKISDGLLGLPGAQGEGIHVKIGVSPVEASTPVVITGSMTVAKIRESLGYSPLADKVMDSVEHGSSRIYCIPVKASTQGTSSEVAHVGTGTGTVAVSGSPYNAFSVIIKITGQGELNSALFTCSIDGGFSFSEEQTVPVGGKYELPSTGLTVTFQAAGDGGTPFVLEDTYSFTCTAPTMTNADVLAAVEKLRNFGELFEFVHIVGESQPALWAAVSTKQKELAETYHKPAFFLLEAYLPEESETANDYALRMKADARTVHNTDLAVVAARSLYMGMDGVTREINNAGIVAGMLSRVSVQTAIGKTAVAAGLNVDKGKMLKLLPDGIQDYIELLDEAQFITFREYAGLDGCYVTNARVLSPTGSDYRYLEDTRVRNKIVREVRSAGLLLLQDDIDLEDQQGELEARAKFMEAVLDRMVDAKEISSASITVPEGQDIITTERMDVIIRYVSRGYIRSIMVDIGRTKPASA